MWKEKIVIFGKHALEESKDLIWGKLRNEKMNEGRME
jgi:hypothetical protein